MGTNFHTDYLASKAIVQVRLDEPNKPGMNGSVVVFRDEATMRQAAQLMGRKGPGDVDVVGQKYNFERKGGGAVTLYAIHYDNVKRDQNNQDKPATPAEIFDDVVPTVPVMATKPGEPQVREAIANYLRSKAKTKE
ncbi:MAG: hypothetical protein EBV03_01150 [Proteobacteria bacterium]|nr:hypothetical protein [Pseudomonadota bacterium]